MRLLITTDTVGGVWTFTRTLTEELLRRGHAVCLVSFGRSPSTAQQAWADALSAQSAQQQTARHPELTPQPKTRHPERSEGPPYFAGLATDASVSPELRAHFTYTATDIPLEWMQNNDRAFEDGQQILLEQIELFHPDLILSNQFCFGRLDTPIPRIVVAHSDVLSWARTCRPSALEPTPWLNLYTSMVQAGLLDAAAVVAPTAWMGKALTVNFFLPQNYLVIPNGAAAEPATDPAPKRKLQAITAGRLWDEAKGLDSLRDLEAPMPILIAGDSTLENTAQTTWPEHLQNLGPLSQPDLHNHFRESAVYLCTSRYEPFGLAALEGALCGCAVVARDLPSLQEVWGEDALYFTGNASLAHVLDTLASDPNLLAHAQERAFRRAAQFTPQRMASSYLQIFESVLQKARSTPHAA